MGAAGLGKLVERTNALRETLAKSKAMSEEMISILSSFDTRLTALESAMRPIQVRTHYYMHNNLKIERTLESAERVLKQYNIPRSVEPRLREGPGRDLDSYCSAIDKLEACIRYFEHHKEYKDSKGVLRHAMEVRQHAMERLSSDFRKELTTDKNIVDPARLVAALPDEAHHEASKAPSSERDPGTANDEPPAGAEADKPAPQGAVASVEPLGPLLPPSSIQFLHSIATRMAKLGPIQVCTRAYREARAGVVDATLKQLGAEKLESEDILRMSWDVLEGKIGSWIAHMRIAIGVLFVEERKLADTVFEGLNPYRDRVYAEVVEGAFALLIGFGTTVAKSQQSPEKLFVLLDMYEVMQELLPQMEKLFSSPACLPALSSAQVLQQQLARTARTTFSEFESAVEKDTLRATVADGTVHPLTSYVVNYVKFLFDYEPTLAQVFEDKPTDAVQPDGTKDKTNSQLAQATQKILTSLVQNLEAKAKAYRDPALVHIFLMNNVHYLVRSIKKSDVAAELLGIAWLERQRRVVQQHAQSYQRTAWGKVLGFLTTQGLAADGALSKNAIKERFKSFNAGFEELHQRHGQWSIPDPTLRDAVLLAVGEVQRPAYASFLRRYQPVLESHAKHPEKYIKYTPEQLETMLQDFFMGSTGAPTK